MRIPPYPASQLKGCFHQSCRAMDEIVAMAVQERATEVLYGGVNTAFLNVKVGVCLLCGERLYTPELARQFGEIEAKLKQQT